MGAAADTGSKHLGNGGVDDLSAPTFWRMSHTTCTSTPYDDVIS